jgi:hypothetical protein
MVVKIKAVDSAESIPEGRTEQGKSGGSANQREAGQFQSQALGSGPFADDDIQGKVFQSRVQYLFYCPVESVDFINKEDVLTAEVG